MSEQTNQTEAADGQSHLTDLLDAELYRHKKTGGTYAVICNATAEATGELLVIYRSTKTGDRWARPAAEFHDGRFDRIALNV